VLTLAGLAVVVAVGATVLWPPVEDRITFENFQRLRGGMTNAEVTAVLGPPGDYETGQGILVADSRRDAIFDAGEFARAPFSTQEEWGSDNALIKVSYSTSGKTVAAFYWGAELEAAGPFDNLLWRAKRQWHRWFP
jgi:hypothetical protein